MPSPEDNLDSIREQARRARDEASRLRQEAERLRDQAGEEGTRARETAQRLRDEVRQAAQQAREEANRLRQEARDLERRLREEARNSGHGHGRSSHGDTGPTTQSEEPFSLDGIRNVDIVQSAGNLVIRFANEGETTGLVTTSSSRGTPKIEVARDGDELRIRIEVTRNWIFRRKQGVTAVVRLAPGLERIRANLGYGDIEVRDLSCPAIRLNAGAGKIAGLSTAGHIDAEVGAGRINLNVHRGLATCHTGTGDVTLDVAEVVPGDYRVDVGIGRIEVRLPPGAPIHITTSTGMGKTTNRYPGALEDAPSRLRANTGIGELVVRVREDTPAPEAPAPSARARAGRAATARRHEVEELRILQLLEQGRISSQEAAELIAALQGAAPPPEEFSDNVP